MNECRERIRRERERDKNTYTSPRLALRRVLLLAEGRQFREAAAIIGRLGAGVLRSVAAELPVDLLVEALPHSAHLLETLLSRLVAVEVTPRPELQPELVAWRLVGLFGGAREHGSSLRARTSGLCRELAEWSPPVTEALDGRRRELDSAVQGLGTHGLTADSSGALISLHVALKNELLHHIEVYKKAVHKLEELSSVTVNQDPASSSHQRLLSLSLPDIERRLIDNKSLLTIVDKPALRQLPVLVKSLEQRVACDKQVLSSVGQIKRIDAAIDVADDRPVAGILMSYSRGCDAVLSLMTERAPASPAPAAPAAPATPAPAPRSPGGSSCSDGYHSDSDTQESDTALTVDAVVSLYAALFSRAAEQALPALAALEPLRNNDQLKYKIIFSVIVLSFRAVITLRERRLGEVRQVLGAAGAEPPAPVLARLAAAAGDVLRLTASSYPLGEAERTVANQRNCRNFSKSLPLAPTDLVCRQVLGTLREYPCLATCAPLHALVAGACRVAWTACCRQPPLRIDTDFTPVLMRPDKHVRFVSSDQRSDLIRSFVWPALMDGHQCLYRAVVIT